MKSIRISFNLLLQCRRACMPPPFPRQNRQLSSLSHHCSETWSLLLKTNQDAKRKNVTIRQIENCTPWQNNDPSEVPTRDAQSPNAIDTSFCFPFFRTKNEKKKKKKKMASHLCRFVCVRQLAHRQIDQRKTNLSIVFCQRPL
jgi:hypothetical protein